MEEVDITTIKTIRTPLTRICPVCHEDILFDKVEKIKNGKKISEKFIKKSKHSVRSCIRNWQSEKLEEAGYIENAEICETCDHYVVDYYCSSEYRYCNNPDFTFTKTEEMIEFQKKFDRGEYNQDAKRGYMPFDKCKPYVDEAGRCDEYERRKKGTSKSS